MAYSTSSDYFVETDEPQYSRVNSREAAKLLARNRQEMIANELSRMASDEYLEDIMQHMRHMEVLLGPHPLSPVFDHAPLTKVASAGRDVT
jgi:hypothetical protein